jgi:putative ABC transport system permease protein
MIAVALRGLAGRKLRAALTALAIVLGVAMVSGTYVFTDTTERATDALFTGAYTGSDAVISGKKIVDAPTSGGATVSAELLAAVRALPEVEAASGGIADVARLVDHEGNPISVRDSAIGFSVDARQDRFNPVQLTDGRWPSGSGEVAIDAGTAEKNGFAIGDTIGVAARKPLRRFTISGFAAFPRLDSIGRLTFAIFDNPTAQAFFGKRGRFDEIYVAAKKGVSPQELVRSIEPILPADSHVLTGDAKVRSQSAGTNKDLAVVQKFLLAFGAAALFVGAFVIFNTLAITVAQRTRELATLRTLGASRRQVLAAVMLEALAIGAAGSVVGLFAGVGLAKGLSALFAALGSAVPQTGTVLATRTVLVSLLVGILITLVAALAPAARATSVPPISAVREGATLPRSPLAPYAPYIAGSVAALGLGLLGAGLFAPGIGVTTVLLLSAIGCLALFVGVALISSRLVKPLASLLGRPAGLLAGAPGRLARENTVRAPARTAVTASALMIGIALVTFVAVLGHALRTSVGRAVDGVVRADYVVTADSGAGPLTPAVAATLATQPGVETLSAVREEQAKAFNADERVAGIDATTITEVMSFDWTQRSRTALARLGADGAVVQRAFAADHDLRVGSSFRLTTAQGKKLTLTVRGIYAPPRFDPVLAPIAISQHTFDASFDRPQNALTLVNTNGGPSAEHARVLRGALKAFPEAELRTKAEFITVREKEIRNLLQLLYVLLALSLLVSLLGMINTLALSVFERTRELGMLRAVGMTRRQARRMIRHESVITALIGAALGLPLGIFLAALVTRALRSEGVVFSLPAVTLAGFALVAVVAGVLAAVLPARRAARLNVLEALQYE